MYASSVNALSEEERLLLKVACCSLLGDALGSVTHRCNQVVACQDAAERDRQVPEGSAGSL
jgi:hypothetical protein